MKEEREMTKIKAEETEIDHLRRQNAELKRLLVLALKQDSSAIHQVLDSLELQNDRETIMSLIHSDLLSYNDLPKQLKDDVKIVCSLFKPERHTRRTSKYDDAHVIHSSQEPITWRELPYHLKVNEEVLSYALKSQFGPKWNQIHHKFHSNVTLMHIALEYEKLSFDDIPYDLKRSNKDIASYGIRHNLLRADDCSSCLEETFYKKVLEDDEIKWEWLPQSLVNNVKFACTISDFSKNLDLAKDILTRFGDFRGDKSFWRKLFQRSNKEETAVLMEYFAPAELFSDRDFMLEVCRSCDSAIRLINQQLINDISFLKVALEEIPLVIKYVPHDTQRLHRNLIIETIGRTSPSLDVAMTFKKHLHPDFWVEGDFALAWITAGHCFPYSVFGGIDVESIWQHSRLLCLQYALKAKSVDHAHFNNFTSDISFMQEVLEHHPELYFNAKGEVTSDPMIMATVFSACPEIAKEVITQFHFEGRDEEITHFLDYLRKELEPFEIFQQYILGNMMSMQTVETTGTFLTLLNQGIETSLLYKKELASYLGIPNGKRLLSLHHAEQNVREVISEWSASLPTQSNKGFH